MQIAMWYERLLEQSEKVSVELRTDASILISIKYRLESDVERALHWWVASFGLYSTVSPRLLQDRVDVEAIIQFCWSVLKLSCGRTMQSSKAYVMASADIAFAGNFRLLSISVVLDRNDFRRLKRSVSTVQCYDELGGTEFI